MDKMKIKTWLETIVSRRMIEITFPGKKGKLKIYKDGTVVWMDPVEDMKTGKVETEKNTILNRGVLPI